MAPGLNIWFVLDFSEGDRRAVARWVTGECGLKATFVLARWNGAELAGPPGLNHCLCWSAA